MNDDILDYINKKVSIIDSIVSTMDKTKGYGKGLNALKSYVETGHPTRITRQNGTIEMLKGLSISEIK